MKLFAQEAVPAPHPVLSEWSSVSRQTSTSSRWMNQRRSSASTTIKNVTLILSGDIDKTAAASLVKKVLWDDQSHGKDNTPPIKARHSQRKVVLSHDDPLLKEPVLLLRWLTPPTCSRKDRTADVACDNPVARKTGRLHKLSQSGPSRFCPMAQARTLTNFSLCSRFTSPPKIVGR